MTQKGTLMGAQAQQLPIRLQVAGGTQCRQLLSVGYFRKFIFGGHL
jgi:hypothetical protein